MRRLRLIDQAATPMNFLNSIIVSQARRKNMAEAIRSHSITVELLKDLAERLNLFAVHPNAGVPDRDRWIAELDGYIAVPKCFEDDTARDFAVYIRRKL
jgi:hypothetical protein